MFTRIRNFNAHVKGHDCKEYSFDIYVNRANIGIGRRGFNSLEEICTERLPVTIYVHIVSFQIQLTLIRGVLIDMFKLFQMQYVFLFFFVSKIKENIP